MTFIPRYFGGLCTLVPMGNEGAGVSVRPLIVAVGSEGTLEAGEHKHGKGI